LAVALALREPGFLPAHVVREVEVEVGEVFALVAGGQFPVQQVDRRVVADDVVRGEQHDVVGRRAADQQHPQQWRAFQVERRVDGGGQERVRLARFLDEGEVVGQIGDRGHPLFGDAVGVDDVGAQRFVPGDDRAQGGGQRGDVEVAGQAQDHRHRVGALVEAKAFGEPQAALSAGERHCVGGVAAGDGWWLGQLDSPLGEKAGQEAVPVSHELVLSVGCA
jgi:hypothetical protein